MFAAVSIVLGAHTIAAMNPVDTHLVIIPGQNGLGGDNIDVVLPYFKNKQHLKHKVETPLQLPDFGQGRCLNYLEQTMRSLNETDKVILYASSQGTATAINYTAKNPDKVNALILESIMLTGNSAIEYNNPLSFVPGSYYFSPYLAKFLYPWYCPAGEQPLFNLNALPKTLPIIIIHTINDSQLSYKDAEALYTYLHYCRKNETESNIYLISHDSGFSPMHVNLLNQNDTQKIKCINDILQKNTLLPLEQNDLKGFYKVQYSPEPILAWKNHFNLILSREKRFWYIDWGIKIIFCSLLLYMISRSGSAKNVFRLVS